MLVRQEKRPYLCTQLSTTKKTKNYGKLSEAQLQITNYNKKNPCPFFAEKPGMKILKI